VLIARRISLVLSMLALCSAGNGSLAAGQRAVPQGTVNGTLQLQVDTPVAGATVGLPFTIGGKTECDQITITCDYFVGDIDYVRISKR